MKIVLVDMANLKYMPYVKAYFNVIDLDKNDVHVIHWKREVIDTTKLDSRIHIHTYENLIDSDKAIKDKFGAIVAYGSYLRREIKKLAPDFLIVHYQTTAVLIYDILIGKYKNRYILDYRDITHEENNLFRKLVANVVKNSAYTFISSEGFKKYLPESDKIHNSHNIDLNLQYDADSLKKRLAEKHNPNNPIRIAFWGRARNDKTNRAFIDAVSKADDIELHYYGTMGEKLEKVIRNSENVYYHGSYASADRYAFAMNADLLLNAFDRDDKNMPYATSNKFYDGFMFYVPQICTSDSVMALKCKKYGIGTLVNIDEPDFLCKIVDYYKNLDIRAFIHNCETAKATVMEEVSEFASIVGKITNGEEK